MIIHDQAIARRVQSAEVTFQNNRQVRVPTNGQRGVVVVDPSATEGWKSVVLYAASGEEVYRLVGA
jgi:hypothetical protein